MTERYPIVPYGFTAWGLTCTCTSTTTIFLSNDHSLYAPILPLMNVMLDFNLEPIDMQGRVQSDKIQKEFLLTVGLEPTTLRCVARCSTELPGLWSKLCYHKDFYTYMYFRYQCIYWYKFGNDEVERILSCTCTVLLHIGIYLHLTNSKDTHKSCICFQHAEYELSTRSVTNLEVVGSSPSVGKTFSFLYFVAFHALLSSRPIPCKWNQA